jgi:serine phosphatase RsbU (regulator of sigma subunit)
MTIGILISKLNVHVFLFVFLCFGTTLSIQANPSTLKEDSLFIKWQKMDLSPDDRLDAFHSYIKDNWLYQPDSLRLMAIQMLDTAKYYNLNVHQALACELIGKSYRHIGNFSKAIVYFMNALKYFNLANDLKGQAFIKYYLGDLYNRMGDNQSAIRFFRESLFIYEELNKPKNMASCLNGIGVLFQEQNQNDSALFYFHKSLNIKREVKDVKGSANSLNNIGLVYFNLTMFDSARYYYKEAYDIMNNLGDPVGMATFNNNIGMTYSAVQDYLRALQYSRKSLDLAKELQDAELIRLVAYEVFRNANKLGFHKEALDAHILYTTLNDSITNKAAYSEAMKQKYKYEYEVQAVSDSIEFAKNLIIKDEQIRSARTYQVVLLLSVVVLLSLAIVFYQRYFLVRKQSDIIKQQQKVVQKYANDITDSITYARRIQRAILPSEESIQESLGECFILYKPKDIVAGDFYWHTEKDGLHFFAVADCTGHGVPGALVSMICSSGLRTAVKEYNLKDPGQILHAVRDYLKEEMDKSQEEVNDGMDISFCIWNPIEQELLWAGAYNPLWLAREGVIHEYKGDRQPVGRSPINRPFTTHRISILPGDILYLFSDGFSDQFGGSHVRKFSSKRLKELLESVFSLSLPQQLQQIEAHFMKWKGDRKQIDDVCIMAVKLSATFQIHTERNNSA